jgi:hypothetical protein
MMYRKATNFWYRDDPSLDDAALEVASQDAESHGRFITLGTEMRPQHFDKMEETPLTFSGLFKKNSVSVL